MNHGGAGTTSGAGAASNAGELNIVSALSRIESKISAATPAQQSDMASIRSELKQMQDSLALDVNHIKSRLDGVENRSKRIEDKLNRHYVDFDPNCTVIFFNASQGADETPEQLINSINDIVQQGLELPGIEVVVAQRLPVRDTADGTRPPGVKAEMPNVNLKVEVLHQKKMLGNKRHYKNIFIRSSKSHAERLLEKTLKTLLNELNLMDKFRFTSHGCLYRVQDDDDGVNPDGEGDDWQRAAGPRWCRGGDNCGRCSDQGHRGRGWGSSAGSRGRGRASSRGQNQRAMRSSMADQDREQPDAVESD